MNSWWKRHFSLYINYNRVTLYWIWKGGNINCTCECESVGVCWNHTLHIQTHTMLDGVVNGYHWCHSCYVCIHVCVCAGATVCVCLSLSAFWYNSLIPLGVCGLVVDVGCHVSDLIVIEAASESRHGVLSVGHLCYNCRRGGYVRWSVKMSECYCLVLCNEWGGEGLRINAA